MILQYVQIENYITKILLTINSHRFLCDLLLTTYIFELCNHLVITNHCDMHIYYLLNIYH